MLQNRKVSCITFVKGAIIWTFLSVVFSPFHLFAQEAEHHHTELKHHRISFVLSHTHIPKGFTSASETSSLIVPSLGLNYDYWFSPRWAVGLHNDMEITTYIVDDHEGAELERERPIIVSLVGIFKPTHQIELIAGVGQEFEKHHNFWVVRFGGEYEFDLPGNWMLGPSLLFDLKEDIYNSLTLGILIGKKF